MHRLVWETLKGDIPTNMTVDHIDNNPANNSIYNLQLLSREDNTRKAVKNKPSPKAFKYEYNHQIYTRKELEDLFHLSRKFWYNNNFKINDRDYRFQDKIFKRV